MQERRVSNINQYAKNLSPSLYKKLQVAVETGKWLDGAPLNTEQKAHTLQLLIAYQKQFNVHPAHFTIDQNGEIHMQNKKILQQQFSDKTDSDDIYRVNL